MTTRGTELRLEGLHWGYGADLGGPLDLTLAAGEALALVGPNGVGKSTLLRTMAGLLQPRRGEVRFANAPIGQGGAQARARRVALLDQGAAVDSELTVEELVTLGRTAHLGLFGNLGADDREAVREAMEACDLEDLRSRRLGRLSGGELQRARLAMALAQRAPLLLLDEPTTHLDLRRRQELFELLARLRRSLGLTLVLVLHELAEAYREADRVCVLAPDGVSEVSADDPLRRQRLARAFGVAEERIILG